MEIIYILLDYFFVPYKYMYKYVKRMFYIKKYRKNLLVVATEKLEIILRTFYNKYFCLSAGKDNFVMIQLANIVAMKLTKNLILFI